MFSSLVSLRNNLHQFARHLTKANPEGMKEKDNRKFTKNLSLVVIQTLI